MAKILVFGDPVLTRRSKEVVLFDSALAELVEEMFRTMVAASGVGLAAPQIGASQAVCIVDPSSGENPLDLLVLINPSILEAQGSQKDEEGCLSFPDITTVVDRPYQIRLRAQRVDGSAFEMSAEGFLARAICHEVDHLQGVLMTDRVSRLKREIIRKKVQKRQKEGTWQS